MDILFLLFLIFVSIIAGAICLLLCKMICSKGKSEDITYYNDQSPVLLSNETATVTMEPLNPTVLLGYNLQANSLPSPSASFDNKILFNEDNKLNSEDRPPSYVEATRSKTDYAFSNVTFSDKN